LNPIGFLFIGAIAGSIGSVMFVAYVNKKNMAAKKNDRKLRKTGGGPSSGSPLNDLDEEKFV
jgi:hypothetical protein